MRASFAVWIALSLACACKSSGPTGDPSADALPPQQPPGKITADVCGGWAEHAVLTVIADGKDASSKCAPAVRDEVATKLEEQKKAMQEGAKSFCLKHVGEAIPVEAANCFLTAKTVRGLHECKLTPIADPEAPQLIAEFDRMRKGCAAPAPSASQ